MSKPNGIHLEVSADDEDVAYLRLPDHPGTAPTVVKKSIRLRELLGEYTGPDLIFDFDENNTLVGVEILK